MTNMKKYLSYLIIFSLGMAVTAFFLNHWIDSSHYHEMHESHHGTQSELHQNNIGMHNHDEVNMPGLQGKDTTEQEVKDLKNIFQMHKGITRVVSNLPNGIVTITEAEDEDLREAIISHVSMMITRIQDGKNPEVIIQSPTLDKLFDAYDDIDTEIELTEKGIKVIQTSKNPDVVKLLQTHAAEVSDMANRGMQAVHERMASQNH
jgi:hypothetical protein